MKRLLALLLIGLLLVACAACSKDKEGDEMIKDYLQKEIEVDRVTVGDSVFHIATVDSETVLVTGYDGKDVPHKVVIPETLNEKTVVGIADEAFYYQSNISEIELPRSVKSIGNYAFAGCSMLQSITLHKEITSVGIGAFLRCTAMTSATFEADGAMTAIPADAFRENSAMTSLHIPAYIKTVGAGAFYSCTALETLTVDEGVLSIGDQCFQNCTALANVTLPASLADTPATAEDGTEYTLPAIGNMAFSGCRSLFVQGVHVPAGSVAEAYFAAMELGLREDSFAITTTEGVLTLTYTTVDNATATVTGFTYKDNDGKDLNLVNLVIPEKLGESLTVAAIGDAAFYNIATLESVTIPATVNSIGGFAFSRAARLKNVTLQGTVAQWDAIVKENTWNWHNNTNNAENKAMPVLLICTDGIMPSTMPTQKGSAVIPVGTDAGVTLDYVFYSDYDFATIVGYRDCKTSTGEAADLTELILPDALDDHKIGGIKSNLFAGETKLAKLRLPATIQRIGTGAFANSALLTEMKFGGTDSDWKAIEMEESAWNTAILNTAVYSDDGSAVIVPGLRRNGEGSAVVTRENGDKLTLTYTFENYNEATVTGYTYKTNADVDADLKQLDLIALSDANFKLVAIADDAFAGCATIEKVIYAGTADAWKTVSISDAAWHADVLGAPVLAADGATVVVPNLAKAGTDSSVITDTDGNTLTLTYTYEDYNKATLTGYTYKDAQNADAALKTLDLTILSRDGYVLVTIKDGTFTSGAEIEKVVFNSTADAWTSVKKSAAGWNAAVVDLIKVECSDITLPGLFAEKSGRGTATVTEANGNKLTVTYTYDNYIEATITGYTYTDSTGAAAELVNLALSENMITDYRVVGIADQAFAACSTIEKVIFDGTSEAWKALKMTAAAWHADVVNTVIIDCTNEDLTGAIAAPADPA